MTLSHFIDSIKPVGRPLGILPNVRPATNYAASRLSENNELLEKSDFTDPLILRYVRQSAAKRLLKNNRVSWCLRRVKDNELPALYRDRLTSKTHFTGVISCSRVWECPVCASKIAQRRREEIAQMIDIHRKNEGFLFMVTYTFSHDRNDELNQTMTRLQKAVDAMKATRQYKDLKTSVKQIGTIRALEITYGLNGWHPHIHEIWFIEPQAPEHAERVQNALKTRLYPLWLNQCKKKNLGEPSEKYGVDVRNASYVTTYISKWGIEDEISKFNAKKSKNGGLSPFQLLSEYIEGDKQAGALFVEYVKAFKGKRQLCYSRGLRKYFELEPELTDEQLAESQTETADLLGIFTLEQWKKIIKHRTNFRDVRAEILRLSEQTNFETVLVFIDSLK